MAPSDRDYQVTVLERQRRKRGLRRPSQGRRNTATGSRDGGGRLLV